MSLGSATEKEDIPPHLNPRTVNILPILNQHQWSEPKVNEHWLVETEDNKKAHTGLASKDMSMRKSSSMDGGLREDDTLGCCNKKA